MTLQRIPVLALPCLLVLLPGCGDKAVNATSNAGSGNASGGTSSGGSGGTSAGGSGTGGASAGAPGGGAPNGGGANTGSCPTHTCSNPTTTIPMDPSDAQAGITLSGFYVDTDTWNAASYQVTQTLCICDYDNWYVTANMNDSAHDGAVKTYPNVHQDFNSSPQISSFSSITSCFAHTAPHVGIYEYAYDIWLNGVASSTSTEVMIWTDNYGQTPSGSSVDTVTFDGASYHVYNANADSYIAFVADQNVTNGTVDILAFFNYIIGKGWIPADSTIGAIDYGVEIVSTDSTDARFELNGFTLTAN